MDSSDIQANEFYQKAKQALETGDVNNGAILIAKALEANFSHSETWQLLHRYFGKKKPFEQFRYEFTKKYYPNKLELIATPATPLPAWIELLPPDAPQENESALFCPRCGRKRLSNASFCTGCGYEYQSPVTPRLQKNDPPYSARLTTIQAEASAPPASAWIPPAPPYSTSHATVQQRPFAPSYPSMQVKETSSESSRSGLVFFTWLSLVAGFLIGMMYEFLIIPGYLLQVLTLILSIVLIRHKPTKSHGWAILIIWLVIETIAFIIGFSYGLHLR